MIHGWKRKHRRKSAHNGNGAVNGNGKLPLTMVSPGERVTLVEIMSGRGVRHRLTELGLIPGVELKVVQDEGGPLLLAVHDSRLALGRGMAHKIMVQTV